MADYEVPTKKDLMLFAAKVSTDPEEILESEYFDYSEDINELLLELRDGEDLTDAVRAELGTLYDEWEAENFPVAEVDEETIQEGGPKPEEPSDEEDPDLLPDPEDV